MVPSTASYEPAMAVLWPESDENPTDRDLDALRQEIEHHPIYRNGYFGRLQRGNFSRATYALHRANFLYRTEFTVKAIAHVCARAAEQDDDHTLILFSHILNEECGDGDATQCHASLMENAHNAFGQVVFGLDPMRTSEARNSALIVAGTRSYRQRLQALSVGSYPRLLGMAMAMESHADKMLTHCRTAFRACAESFGGSEFVQKVEVYFNVHLDGGVEQRHADDAATCARRNCRSAADFAEIAYGARATLAIQLLMWDELLQKRIEIEGELDA
jgi:hypothetical protein